MKVARTWIGGGRTDHTSTTDHGNSWATANTTKILPYLGIDLRHCQQFSPKYTDSHGLTLPIAL